MDDLIVDKYVVMIHSVGATYVVSDYRGSMSTGSDEWTRRRDGALGAVMSLESARRIFINPAIGNAPVPKGILTIYEVQASRLYSRDLSVDGSRVAAEEEEVARQKALSKLTPYEIKLVRKRN